MISKFEIKHIVYLCNLAFNSNYKKHNWKKVDNNFFTLLPIPKSFTILYNFMGSQILPKLTDSFFCTDHFSGITLPNSKPSKILKYKNITGFDIKALWDLARFQFIETIYPFSQPSTENEFVENKKCLVKYIINFKSNNKPYCGPNWACTMDVAIRAVNILYFTLYYNSKKCMSKGDMDLISNFLIDHLNFTYKNLEWVPEKRGNHYLSNICGLLILAVNFELLPKNKKVLKFAINELVSELSLQVNDDGTYFENSTAYHRLYLEMFFYTVCFLKGASPEIKDFIFTSIEEGHKVGKDLDDFITIQFHPLLEKGVKFAWDITLHDGTFHQVGDNDSGRFINRDNVWSEEFVEAYGNDLIRNSFFSICRDIEHYLGRTAAYKVGKPSVTAKVNKADLQLFNKHEILLKDGAENMSSFSYPDFGLYGFKSESFYLGFRCGADKKTKTTHAHEDQLSFEFFQRGNEVYTYRDKGSYTYTRDPEMRNFFRSHLSHLIPVFTDISQGSSTGIFNFKYIGSFCLNSFANDSLEGVWSYEDRVILREIIVTNDRVLINDYVSSKHYDLVVPNKWGAEGLKYSPEYNVKIDL